MSALLPFDCGLALPHRAPSPLLDVQLRRRMGGAWRAPGSCMAEPAWSEMHFGLHHVRAFTSSTEETRRRVLARVAQHYLAEGYFIEKMGTAFGAKMILLSESVEERMLYASFAADEARHLALLLPHLEGAPAAADASPFHRLLADVVTQGARDTLVYVIQVVLEGWGISHYRSMARGCRDESLALALEVIVHDEAAHYASGVALHHERAFSQADEAAAFETMAAFLAMVAAGPLAVLDALDEESGGLTREERARAFEELRGRAHAAERLARLRRLMGREPMVERLAQLGAFAPRPLEERR